MTQLTLRNGLQGAPGEQAMILSELAHRIAFVVWSRFILSALSQGLWGLLFASPVLLSCILREVLVTDTERAGSSGPELEKVFSCQCLRNSGHGPAE